MRILLSAILVAAGIAIGGAVPAISSFIQGKLTLIGVSKGLFTPAAGPGAAKPDSPKAEAGHADGDGHDHGQKAESPKPSHGQSGHAHNDGEDYAEEGVIKMRSEQLTGQDIKLAPVEGGTLSRHLLVPGTITPDTDRIARVPAKVVGTVAEMRKRLG
ncbi:efflux transporter periplasmic adaptor subunit, partial [Methylobacterium oxalidis]